MIVMETRYSSAPVLLNLVIQEKQCDGNTEKGNREKGKIKIKRDKVKTKKNKKKFMYPVVQSLWREPVNGGLSAQSSLPLEVDTW